MVAKISSYEEYRQKRMEENKKRMEALNLTKLSQSVRNFSSLKPSPVISASNPLALSPPSIHSICIFITKLTCVFFSLIIFFNPQMKHVKPRTVEKQVVVVRRSSRVANLPAPVYKEVSHLFLCLNIFFPFWIWFVFVVYVRVIINDLFIHS